MTNHSQKLTLLTLDNNTYTFLSLAVLPNSATISHKSGTNLEYTINIHYVYSQLKHETLTIISTSIFEGLLEEVRF